MVRKISLFTLFILFAAVCSASEKISLDSHSTIKSTIAEIGSTTVMVEYKTLSGYSAMNGTLESEKLAIESINTAADIFKSQVSKPLADNIRHQYKYSPILLIEANSETLNELLNNSRVKKIYENRRNYPTLEESVPLTFPSQPTSKFTGGTNWAVAVLDTGVDSNHSFLKADGVKKVVSEACFSRGGYGTEYREVDSLCPNNGFSQIGGGSGLHCSGYSGCDHGTHVAGIAAGNSGVANDGKIIAIQVFTGIRDVYRKNICGNGTGQNCIVSFNSDVLKGLERVYALRNTHSIAAVNLSLGGGDFSGSCDTENTPITNMINNLKTAKIATVIASGNDGFSSKVNFPGCISEAVTVGATYDTGSNIDTETSYSNSSPVVDLFAPGSLINSSVPGGGFSNFNGTSMATPHVAGAFAVLRSAKPEASIDQLEKLLKSSGPTITGKGGIERNRLAITSVLRKLMLNISPINYLLLDDD